MLHHQKKFAMLLHDTDQQRMVVVSYLRPKVVRSFNCIHQMMPTGQELTGDLMLRHADSFGSISYYRITARHYNEAMTTIESIATPNCWLRRAEGSKPRPRQKCLSCDHSGLWNLNISVK